MFGGLVFSGRFSEGNASLFGALVFGFISSAFSFVYFSRRNERLDYVATGADAMLLIVYWSYFLAFIVNLGRLLLDSLV